MPYRHILYYVPETTVFVLGIWFFALCLWSMVLLKRAHFLAGSVWLAIDRRGLMVRDWLGRTVELKWSEIDWFAHERKLNADEFVFRSRSKGLSGTIALGDLVEDGREIMAVIETCSGRKI